MLFHLDAFLSSACTIAEMAERGRDNHPRHPGVERLDRLTRELDRLRVIAEVKMADRQNVEVLARARREWAQVDRPTTPKNVVNLMDALRRSVANDTGKRAAKPKGKKRVQGQGEMLLPIAGSKAAARKSAAQPATRQKKAG